MRILRLQVPLALALLLLAGCGAEYNARAAQAGLEGDRLTLGSVQKNIRKGMNATQVLEVMGSPNIVTSGDEGTETWVYDKIATDTVHSESGAWWFLVGAGGAPVGSGFAAGAPGGGGGMSSGATSQSQRTLTVIIKFDSQKRVKDLAYHSSSF
jgi:outer membrane protein assembly factor BamE (lipoprotein component of BamABCDE complex)